MQHDRKLVTAQPGHHVGTEDAVAELSGEADQQLVAGVVAEGVVDLFEAVHVEQKVEGYQWKTVARGLAVTISIGLAVRGESPDPESQLAIADRRLHLAKKTGRNRVIGMD